MTKNEMITWYLNQADRDGVRNYGDHLTMMDVKVLMSMWHDQESTPAKFSQDDIIKLKEVNDSNLINKLEKLGLFGKI